MSSLRPAATTSTRLDKKASGALRQVPGAKARLDLPERSWCLRAAKTYNTLPLVNVCCRDTKKLGEAIKVQNS